MKLVIGSKNYSSWSMRPWLLLTHFQIEFDEVEVALFSDGYRQELAKYSPTCKVPVLLDKGAEIWDSLAICEYVSEQYLAGRGWPEAILERARCRALSAEMHSGFACIRAEMPMNCRAKRQVSLSEDLVKEINRIDQLWSDAIADSGGPYLFGDFSIADCMYAPVVSRFSTYQVALSDRAQSYCSTICGNSAYQAWLAAARSDFRVIDFCEVGEECAP